MNASPAWFELGRDVSLFPYTAIPTNPHLKGPNDRLLVSAELQRRDQAVLKWMDNAKESFALIGAIMSIVQPELYHTGRGALEKLFNEPDVVGKHIELFDALEAWWIPFSAMTVVSNRETPLHRDMGGRVDWCDMLIALGKYEHGRLALPGLGVTYRYNPGTVVAFSGMAFEHGATCPGNRACIALYMRNNVIRRLKLPTPSWLNASDYAGRAGSL